MACARVVNMKRVLTAMAVVGGAMLVAGAGGSETPRKAGYVVLKGTPYQRGLTHGRVLRAEIQASVAAWKESLRRTYGTDPERFIRAFMARTNFQPAIEKWTPGLLDEVRGIAEGSGIGFDALFVYQLPDEYWVNGKAVMSEHCSGVAVAGIEGRSAIVAQNLDMEKFRDGHQTVLRIVEDDGTEALVFTQAGLVAFNGMNNRGVGVTVNTLTQLANSRTGLPVAFVVRGILRTKSFEEAVKFVKAVPHASGQNYMIGGDGQVADFEAAAGAVVAVTPRAQGVYLHTNHPLANTDYSRGYRPGEESKPSSTTGRFSALESRLAGSARPDSELVKAALRSRDSAQFPVCVRKSDTVDPDSSFTYGSAVMVLAKRPELWLTVGPPDGQEYQRYSFVSQ